MAEFVLRRRDGSEHIVLVDEEDLGKVLAIKWRVLAPKGSRTKYAVSVANGLLHRFVMNVNDRAVEVDHVNCNALDNRKSNLRLATRSENARNQRMNVRNTSGFKGACWDKKRGLWLASIVHHQKFINLGYYRTAEEAHARYCEAATELHGEFRRTS